MKREELGEIKGVIASGWLVNEGGSMDQFKDSLAHGLKVVLFVAASGAVSALVNWLAGIHPTTQVGIIEVMIANGLLAATGKWLKGNN